MGTVAFNREKMNEPTRTLLAVVKFPGKGEAATIL